MKNKKFKKEFSKAFTLIELLLVIAIIALLSSIVMASMASARNKAKDAALLQSIKQLQVAFEMYKDDNGFYPLRNLPDYSCMFPANCSNRPTGDPGFGPSDLEFYLTDALVPKYIASLEGLFEGVTDPEEFYNYGDIPSLYYVYKPETLSTIYNQNFGKCGDKFYTDDEYIIAILKYRGSYSDSSNYGTPLWEMNLPFEIWGASDDFDLNYYCVTP